MQFLWVGVQFIQLHYNTEHFLLDIQAVTGGQKQEDKEKVLWVKFEEADINGRETNRTICKGLVHTLVNFATSEWITIVAQVAYAGVFCPYAFTVKGLDGPKGELDCKQFRITGT